MTGVLQEDSHVKTQTRIMLCEDGDQRVAFTSQGTPGATGI